MFNFKKPKNLLHLYHRELQRDRSSSSSPVATKPRPWLRFANIGIWLVVFIVIGSLINLWYILPSIQSAYHDATLAKSKLEQSLVAYRNRELSQAQALLSESQTLLTQTSDNLRLIRSTPIAWTPYFHAQLSDLSSIVDLSVRLTRTASDLTASSIGILSVLPDYSLPNYTKLTPDQKQSFWHSVSLAAPQLASAEAELNSISSELAAIGTPDFFKLAQIDLDLVNDHLTQFQATVASANFYAQVLPAAMGYPKPSRWLIILQNNHELRPTGGFIGSYGVMEVTNGDITKLNTADSYHLDMPVKDKFKVEPPAPLKRYLGVTNWYFRDSNWSPDWPTSAQKVAWFYREENKLLPQPATPDQFDFVVAVTPELIIDLLEITGPIKVDNRTYTKDNFMELLQSTTEKDYQALGLSSWNRKADIGRITGAMYARLIDSLDSRRPEILAVLQNNLNRKNVLVYATDPQLADKLRSNNWDGHLEQSTNDYLMVVDANLAALKTDAVINRNLNYQVVETADGLLAKLTINYANTGVYTWKTTKYRSYTRVFVPEGSQLVKAAGFFGSQADLTVGSELGKTYFGGWLEIEPGKIGHLYFEYLLPDHLWQAVRAKNYQLTIQKQPGSNVSDLQVQLQFNKAIRSFQPQSLHATLSDKQMTWQDDLDTDKNFSVSFY